MSQWSIEIHKGKDQRPFFRDHALHRLAAHQITRWNWHSRLQPEFVYDTQKFFDVGQIHIQRKIDVQGYPLDPVKNRRNASADDEFHPGIRECEENFVNVIAHSIVLWSELATSDLTFYLLTLTSHFSLLTSGHRSASSAVS